MTPDLTTAVSVFAAGITFALTMTVMLQILYGFFRSLREWMGFGRDL